jgi:hypothetical protein
MKERRYQVSDRIEIDAPVEQVYAAAVDPALVPVYAPEIVRIERLEKIGDGVELVRSHLKVGWLRFAHLYRYRYRPTSHYSGLQEGAGLFRGYFSLSFSARGEATIVSHSEGILSPVPGLARALGFLYFRVLARGGVGEELKRLKHLAESRFNESRKVINETCEVLSS